MCGYNTLALVCHAHLITRMNAWLLFEGGSCFFELAKSIATIWGVVTIQANTVCVCLCVRERKRNTMCDVCGRESVSERKICMCV